MRSCSGSPVFSLGPAGPCLSFPSLSPGLPLPLLPPSRTLQGSECVLRRILRGGPSRSLFLSWVSVCLLLSLFLSASVCLCPHRCSSRSHSPSLSPSPAPTPSLGTSVSEPVCPPHPRLCPGFLLSCLCPSLPCRLPRPFVDTSPQSPGPPPAWLGSRRRKYLSWWDPPHPTPAPPHASQAIHHRSWRLGRFICHPLPAALPSNHTISHGWRRPPGGPA